MLALRPHPRSLSNREGCQNVLIIEGKIKNKSVSALIEISVHFVNGIKVQMSFITEVLRLNCNTNRNRGVTDFGLLFFVSFFCRGKRKKVQTLLTSPSVPLQ